VETETSSSFSADRRKIRTPRLRNLTHLCLPLPFFIFQAHTVIDGNGNKRPREDDEGDEAVDGTGKKHAPVTLVSNLGPNGAEGEKDIDQYYSGGDKGQDPAAGDDPTVEVCVASVVRPSDVFAPQSCMHC
jgi:hypothetical protein